MMILSNLISVRGNINQKLGMIRQLVRKTPGIIYWFSTMGVVQLYPKE